MTPSSWARIAGKVPRGLIGMVATIIVVETFIASHHLDFTRFYIHDWSTIGGTVQRKAHDRSMLCFGDSMVKFGVLPRVVWQRTGERVYNLSVCGGQAASSYFLLRRAIEARSRPSIVLVNYSPHLLAAGPRHNLRQWPELLGPAESVELGLASRHAGFCAELALGWIFPTIKDRDEVRGNVLAALGEGRLEARDDVLAHTLTWERNLGADVHPDRPAYRGEVDEADRGYFPSKWSCHPFNEFFIHRFLDLAASRGIRVVCLLPPTVPQFQARRDDLGLEAAYTAFLGRLLEKHDNLSIFDGRHGGYAHSLFVDPLHLNQRGAERLSTAIAAAVAAMPRRDMPDSPRWVDLPDPRPRTADDFATEGMPSRVALRLPTGGSIR